MISDVMLERDKISTYPETSKAYELWIHTNPQFSDILFRTTSITSLGFTKVLNALFNQVILFSKVLPGSYFAIALKDYDTNDFIVKKFLKLDPVIIPELSIITPDQILYDNGKISILTNQKYNGFKAYFFLSFQNLDLYQDDFELNVLPADFGCIGIETIQFGTASLNFNADFSCLIAVGIIK